MARASKTPVTAPTQPERVEYDGCYLITAVSKTGQVFKTYSRGYKLKSWLAFEQSLGSEASYQAVTEAEFETHQWYNQPYEEPDKLKAAKPKASKTPAKKATKAVAKKPQKTTTKTVAKKPQKKVTKKS